MKPVEAKHNWLIDLIINDPKYIIFPNGKIFNVKGKEVGYVKETEQTNRYVQYRYLTYRYGGKKYEVKFHRIIYRKFVGELIYGLVVHHIDDNSLNNAVENLEQTTQKKNIGYIKR